MLKSRLRMLIFIFLVLLIAIIMLFILNYDLVAVAALLVLAGFSFYLHGVLVEELFIYFLKTNSGRLEYDYIINQLGRRRSEKALARLEKKQLVQKDGSVVKLLHQDYLTAFDIQKSQKSRKHNP